FGIRQKSGDERQHTDERRGLRIALQLRKHTALVRELQIGENGLKRSVSARIHRAGCRIEQGRNDIRQARAEWIRKVERLYQTFASARFQTAWLGRTFALMQGIRIRARNEKYGETVQRVAREIGCGRHCGGNQPTVFE